MLHHDISAQNSTLESIKIAIDNVSVASSYYTVDLVAAELTKAYTSSTTQTERTVATMVDLYFDIRDELLARQRM